MTINQRIGVICIQGDFAKHIEALERCGVPAQSIIQVRTPEDLEKADRVIIPGGESTTVGLLMERFGLAHALRKAAKSGVPIWGTCMGMILLAKEVEASSQRTLGILDITVQRNAFGAQIHSFETSLEFEPLPTPIYGVFIRAPIVRKTGPQVKVLAQYQNKTVAVQQGKILGTSFHPELTEDTQVHKWFLGL